jgi:hypothetical protein
LTASALLLVASGGFVYGVLVGRYRYPPYRLVENFHEKFIKSDEQKARERAAEARFWEPARDVPLNDVPALIAIRNEADVTAKRQRLVEVIWGGRGYPRERMPDAVVPNVADEAFAGLTNLAALDRLTVEMDYGINSVAYHFRPAGANNKLVIYHAGHAQDLAAARRQIAFFVGRGYAVVALAMPLEGTNSRPVVEVAGVGRMRLTSHAQLAYLDAPLRFFAEPVVAALNYAERNYAYDLVAMAGLSGGGWTTTLCAALDERIARSYPAAGSVPEVLRGRWLDWGDFEQYTPELYRAANTLELYVLGAHGAGRRQLQVLNQFDNCCFYGLRHRAYEPHVRARLAELGRGSFSVLLDTTHRRHDLSDFALGEIARDLEN